MIFTITSICSATNQLISVVALSKHKVVIIDENSERKVLSIGDTTSSGLTLISANASTAIFKNSTGNLISISLNNEISSTYSNTKNNSKSSDNKSSDNKNNNEIETIKLNKRNQYVATITINNKDASAIIDTGANFVTLNSHIAEQLGLSYKNSAKINVNTASDNTAGYKITLPNLKLGNINLSNIEAIVIDGNNPETILIGMSFLKNLDLQYSGDQLEIKKHVEKPNNSVVTTPAASTTTVQSPATTTPSPTTPVPAASTTTTAPSSATTPTNPAKTILPPITTNKH
jgi:aspartyl protease family protein